MTVSSEVYALLNQGLDTQASPHWLSVLLQGLWSRTGRAPEAISKLPPTEVSREQLLRQAYAHCAELFSSDQSLCGLVHLVDRQDVHAFEALRAFHESGGRLFMSAVERFEVFPWGTAVYLSDEDFLRLGPSEANVAAERFFEAIAWGRDGRYRLFCLGLLESSEDQLADVAFLLTDPAGAPVKVAEWQGDRLADMLMTVAFQPRH